MRYLETADLAKLFRTLHEHASPKQHVLALTQFFTGSRIGQVLALRGSDVRQYGNRWVIQIPAAKNGQDGLRDLHVDADPAFDMTPLIAMAQEAGDHKLFGGLDRRYFNRVLNKCAEMAGIIHVSSHTFRHSAAMIVMGETQRVGAVSQFLLHRSASSAYIYLQEVDGRHAQAAMNALKL